MFSTDILRTVLQQEEGAWEWWDATLQQWVNTETFNVGGVTQYEFPANAWQAGEYEWAVATKDQPGDASEYADSFSLTAAPAGQTFQIAISAALSLTPELTKGKRAPRVVAASLVDAVALSRVKQVPRLIAPTLTLTPSLARRRFLSHDINASMLAQLALAKKALRQISAGLVLTPVLVPIKVKPHALSTGLTLAVAMDDAKRTPRVISALLATSLTMNRKLFKPVSVGLTLTPQIAFGKKATRTLAASLILTTAMNFTRRQARTIAADLTLNPVLVDDVTHRHTIAAGLSLSPTMNRKLFRLMAVVLAGNPAQSRARFYKRELNSTLMLASAIALRTIRLYRISLEALLSLSPALGVEHTVFQQLDTSLALTAALTRGLELQIEAALALEAELRSVKPVKLLLAAILGLTPALEVVETGGEFTLAASLALNPQIDLRRLYFENTLLGVEIPSILLDAALDEAKLLQADEPDPTVILKGRP